MRLTRFEKMPNLSYCLDKGIATFTINPNTSRKGRHPMPRELLDMIVFAEGGALKHISQSLEFSLSPHQILDLLQSEGNFRGGSIYVDLLESASLNQKSTALEAYPDTFEKISVPRPAKEDKQQRQARITRAMMSGILQRHGITDEDIIFLLVISSEDYLPIIESLLQDGRRIILYLTKDIFVGTDRILSRHPWMLHVRYFCKTEDPEAKRQIGTALIESGGLDPANQTRAMYQPDTGQFDFVRKLLQSHAKCPECRATIHVGDIHRHFCGMNLPTSITGLMNEQSAVQHVETIKHGQAPAFLRWLSRALKDEVLEHQFAYLFERASSVQMSVSEAIHLIKFVATYDDGRGVPREAIQSNPQLAPCLDTEILMASKGKIRVPELWKDSLLQICDACYSILKPPLVLFRNLKIDEGSNSNEIRAAVEKALKEAGGQIRGYRDAIRQERIRNQNPGYRFIALTDSEYPAQMEEEDVRLFGRLLNAVRCYADTGRFYPIEEVAYITAACYDERYLLFMLATLIENGLVINMDSTFLFDRCHSVFKYFEEAPKSSANASPSPAAA